MSDQALQNAKAERDHISSEIALLQQREISLRRRLEKANAFITQWHEFASLATVGSDSQPTPAIIAADERADTQPQDKPSDRAAALRKRATGNPRKEDVGHVARTLISERGKPIERAELFDLVRDKGFEIKGADPLMVFSTMLWRVPELVVRLPNHGYWLPEKPYEPASYDPSEEVEEDAEEIVMEIAAETGQLPDLGEGDISDDIVDEALDQLERTGEVENKSFYKET